MSEKNGLATAAQLMAGAGKRRYRELTLPTSKMHVRIRSLTEREVSKYQSATYASRGTGLKRSKLEDASRRLIVLCLVDQEGNPILTEADLAGLAEWDAADTGHIYEEAAAHCGLNQNDIEELVGNSEGIPADSALSD